MIANAFRPIALERIGESGLRITWSDGHSSEYSWRWLREHCPCASCREQRQSSKGSASATVAANQKTASGGKIALAVLRTGEVAGSPYHAIQVTPVGRYAYKMVWADGHDTGIYSFDLLRQLCQCPQCCQTRSTATPTGTSPAS